MQFYSGDWNGTKADHTKAVQTALDSGSSVLLPAGEIYLTAELTLRQRSGIVIQGAGRGLTRIVQRKLGCGIFRVWGTRLRFEDFELDWESSHEQSDNTAFAFKAWEKITPGAILATSIIRNIQIRNAAIGIDLRNSIGYSNTFEDIGISSFTVAALSCDARTAHTQSRFDAWHISNQPGPYQVGQSPEASSHTIQLPTAKARELRKGMAVVIHGADTDTKALRWITDYDQSTGLARFYPAIKQGRRSDVRFELSIMKAGSEACMNFCGFTDLHIGMLAFEFIRLAESTPAPITFENCNAVVVDVLRFERISFSARSSALVSAAGRAAVSVGALQTQYIGALTALGCERISIGRTYNEAQINFSIIEGDHWYATAKVQWAHAAGRCRAGQGGGSAFDSLPTGDGTLLPSGQAYDVLGQHRQTAIIGRPSRERRRVSSDEGTPSSYRHSIMQGPDVVRFAGAIHKDIIFHLDQTDRVAGAEVTIDRTVHAQGAGVIIVKAGEVTVGVLQHPGTSLRIICDGEHYSLVSA